MLPSSDAALRNRAPILEVLARHVRTGDHVLEIASGTGQHAVWLAPRLGVTWQPTDMDPDARAAVDAWRAADPADARGADWRDPGPLPGTVLPAIPLDVRARPWPIGGGRPDVIVCVNMIHISPWEATQALLRGAGELSPRVLYLYGPFKRGRKHTAPSNEAFDAWLKAKDPAYGVRDLEAVLDEARTHRLEILEVEEMPANNLSVVFA